MVPVSPAIRSHSCSFVKSRSSGVIDSPHVVLAGARARIPNLAALAIRGCGSFIERCSYDSCFREFTSHADVKRCADRGLFCRQIRETDVFLQSDGRPSARDMTRLTAMNKYRVMISCDLFSDHLE